MVPLIISPHASVAVLKTLDTHTHKHTYVRLLALKSPSSESFLDLSKRSRLLGERIGQICVWRGSGGTIRWLRVVRGKDGLEGGGEKLKSNKKGEGVEIVEVWKF